MPCLSVKSMFLSRVSSKDLGTEASRDDLHRVSRECRGKGRERGRSKPGYDTEFGSNCGCHLGDLSRGRRE